MFANMASFDGHLKCACYSDMGVGEDLCVMKKDCTSYMSFTVD